jgi:hypothetical protein
MLGEFESESIDLHVVVVWSGVVEWGAWAGGSELGGAAGVLQSPTAAARCRAPTQIGERVTGALVGEA